MQSLTLIDFFGRPIQTSLDQLCSVQINMPVPLLKVDGPVPPVAESVSEGNQGGGGPNAFVSLFTGIPPFTIERLDIPMVIDKKVSDEFMKIAFAIFPFLNRHQSRPYDKTKCDEIVTIVSELLNQGEYVEKSESINLNAIWKGLKDACEYDPSKVDVRLQYFSYSGFVANNEQDLIDAIFHISHNSSGLCDSWVSFMCAVFLIALQSKSMYVLRGENNLPAWRDMVMHNVILHALNLIYLKQTVQYWDFQKDPSHMPPIIRKFFDSLLRRHPGLAQIVSFETVGPESLVDAIREQTEDIPLLPHLYPYSLTLCMSNEKRVEFLIKTYIQGFTSIMKDQQKQQTITDSLYSTIFTLTRNIVTVIAKSATPVFIDNSIVQAAEYMMGSNRESLNEKTIEFVSNLNLIP